MPGDHSATKYPGSAVRRCYPTLVIVLTIRVEQASGFTNWLAGSLRRLEMHASTCPVGFRLSVYRITTTGCLYCRSRSLRR